MIVRCGYSNVMPSLPDKRACLAVLNVCASLHRTLITEYGHMSPSWQLHTFTGLVRLHAYCESCHSFAAPNSQNGHVGNFDVDRI